MFLINSYGDLIGGNAGFSLTGSTSGITLVFNTVLGFWVVVGSHVVSDFDP